MPTLPSNRPSTLDINFDQYAGFTANGLPILPLTGEDSVTTQLDSGSRIEPGRDGVITFSFYNAQHANGWLASGHYPGYLRDAEGNFIGIDGGSAMSPFSPEQEAAARAAIEMWDDLIAVDFQEVNGHGSGTADIVFANSADPGQAFAYRGGSIHGAWDGFLGDVFIADPDLNSSNLDLGFGQYGRTTLIHEIGHSLGLSHPGNYNASDDNDGDGQPDPITYAGDAEYFQDSQQYTIMSYFGAWNTGGSPIDWLYSGGIFYDSSPQGPMLHDIAVIQQAYGADPTTRAGETTYGFNSTAGNPLYDFNENPLPYYAVYDAGGEDTINLSGFQSSQYINLTPGAFSSIGDVTISTEEFGAAFHDGYLAAFGDDLYEFGYTDAALGVIALGVLAETQAANAGAIEFDTGISGIGAVNYENFAIAYNTIIENAVGGQGRDLLVGNSADNSLQGQAGDDVIAGGDGADTLIGGAGDDTLYGEEGSDLFVFANDGSTDTIADFTTGEDTIDLSELGEDVAWSAVSFDQATHTVTVDVADGPDLTFVLSNVDAVNQSDFLFG